MRRLNTVVGSNSHVPNRRNRIEGDAVLLLEGDHLLTDELEKKIQSLKSLNIEIGIEVQQQCKFLEEMVEDFDDAEGFLQKGMMRVKNLAIKKGCSPTVCLFLFTLGVFTVLWLIIKFKS